MVATLALFVPFAFTGTALSADPALVDALHCYGLSALLIGAGLLAILALPHTDREIESTDRVARSLAAIPLRALSRLAAHSAQLHGRSAS
jgi:hypothetical protein